MSVAVDENIRIPFDGKLNFEFENFGNCLSNDAAIIDVLRDDCLHAFTSRSDLNDDETSSVNSNEYHNSGFTYFQRSDLKPRCRLEELALSIFRFHTKNAKFKDELSGAEWWTQVVDSEDDIGFHWDRDYGHEGSTGENLYPHLATVTYLTNRGGPTVILSKGGMQSSDDCHSGPANEIVLSKPVIGKHIKFDGRLLHAAPSNLISNDLSERSELPKGIISRDNHQIPDKFKRVTFLVNIWLNRIPQQAVSFPQCSVGKFAQLQSGTVLSHFDDFTFCGSGSKSMIGDVSLKSSVSSRQKSSVVHVVAPSILILSEIQKGTLDLHRWNFINGGKRYRVCVPLPSSERLLKLSIKCSAFRFIYAGSGVTAQVESLEEIISDNGDTTKRKKMRRLFWRPFHMKLF
jgi:hypothetical protein